MICPPYPPHRHRRWGATVKTSQDIHSGLQSGCCFRVLSLRQLKPSEHRASWNGMQASRCVRVPTSSIEPRSGSIGNGRQRSPLLCRPCWLYRHLSRVLGSLMDEPTSTLALSHQTLPKRAAARAVLSPFAMAGLQRSPIASAR